MALTELRSVDLVLPDLIQQGLVADVEKQGRFLAVPLSLLQRVGDRLYLCFILNVANDRLEPGLWLCARRSFLLFLNAGAQFVQGPVLIAKDQKALYKI